MALNKKDCIAAVKQAGASELEALDIVDMLLEQKARLKASGDLTPQNLSRAWSATAEAGAPAGDTAPPHCLGAGQVPRGCGLR